MNTGWKPPQPHPSNQSIYFHKEFVLQHPMGLLIIEGSLCIQNNPINEKLLASISVTHFLPKAK